MGTGDNQIIIIPGANNELKPADVLEAEQLIKNAKVAVFGFEIPLETTLAGMELCKKYNCGYFLRDSVIPVNIFSK